MPAVGAPRGTPVIPERTGAGRAASREGGDVLRADIAGHNPPNSPHPPPANRDDASGNGRRRIDKDENRRRTVPSAPIAIHKCAPATAVIDPVGGCHARGARFSGGPTSARKLKGNFAT